VFGAYIGSLHFMTTNREKIAGSQPRAFGYIALGVSVWVCMCVIKLLTSVESVAEIFWKRTREKDRYP